MSSVSSCVEKFRWESSPEISTTINTKLCLKVEGQEEVEQILFKFGPLKKKRWDKTNNKKSPCPCSLLCIHLMNVISCCCKICPTPSSFFPRHVRSIQMESLMTLSISHWQTWQLKNLLVLME